MEAFLFWVLAAGAVTASVLVIGQRNPMRSVLLLILSFIALSGLYVLLGSPFAAVIQIIIYAGAIMVLFIFVIMLLNAGTEHKGRRTWATYAGVPLLMVFLGLIAIGITHHLPASENVMFGQFTKGSPLQFGRSLFTVYLLPFEVTSVLILIAILGAVVLAKKEID